MQVINCNDYKKVCQHYKEVTYNGYHTSFNSLQIKTHDSELRGQEEAVTTECMIKAGTTRLT